MAYDYESDLQRLKEQQKASAIADLQKERDTSLSNLNAEEATIKPTYYKKKDSANVQNQVAAKNFHEYLVNSGRSNSGIGAQYEMSRQNTLQRNLNDLNKEEASAIADVARRKTDVNNAYNTGLTSANAQIEANYITNLLAERQKAWEREQAEKEFNESVRQFNTSLAASRSSGGGGGSRSSGSSRSSGKTTSSDTLEWKPNGAYTATVQGNYITYTDKSNSNNKISVPKGYNPFTGTYNKDVANGVFGNGYQPNNIEGEKLTSSGKVTTYNGQKQTIWKTSDGQKWLWNGQTNSYESV